MKAALVPQGTRVMSCGILYTCSRDRRDVAKPPPGSRESEVRSVSVPVLG